MQTLKDIPNQSYFHNSCTHSCIPSLTHSSKTTKIQGEILWVKIPCNPAFPSFESYYPIEPSNKKINNIQCEKLYTGGKAVILKSQTWGRKGVMGV